MTVTDTAYCTEIDLLVGDDFVAAAGSKAKYVRLAADEMDGKLGYVYVTPIPMNGLPLNQQNLLKSINQRLATGRLIMSQALGTQDNNVNAYALRLVAEAQADLMSIANGQVDLATARADAAGQSEGVIEDPQVDDPYARMPGAWNPDAMSAVTIFEKSFMTERSPIAPPLYFTPGTNIDGDGSIEKVR